MSEQNPERPKIRKPRKKKALALTPEEAKAASLAEELEYENPDNTLYSTDPLFLINKSPTPAQINFAFERQIPIVVILSNEKFTTIQERQEWEIMNVIRIDNVFYEWARDHQNIQHFKNKWKRIAVDTHLSNLRYEQDHYNKLQNNEPNETKNNNLNPLLHIFDSLVNLKKRNGEEPPNFIIGGGFDGPS